ncbi:MAG: hypothetical protein NC302_00310 [Bacteroidales bacterium]|nr:hypothetical protein [Bacteroidales bacterium]MCM1414349.1 hypothetical protein [bacterium]MCM1422231.1 hypothetical protein [bacterium]
MEEMKENKFLILTIVFCTVAGVQFSLAFWHDDVTRILGGILFSVGAVLAWREWKKQKQSEVSQNWKDS